MNNAMLAMMLGGAEILILLLLVIVMASLLGAVVLVVWLTRRARPHTPVHPPTQQPRPGGPAVPAVCPRCGSVLPPESPQGLCPRCVLGVGLATHTEAGSESGPQGTKVMEPPPSTADIAKHFPQLQILDCLGRGGMGVVYKARQPKLNRLVALKILAPEKGADPKFAERFLREAQALARLNHPNIVTVHDYGEAEGLYYLLMEYVDGMTLRQLLQGQKLAPEEALSIVPKICEALQFAHEQGVVHRDIKPENVLLDKQGRVKIADFGIAKIVAADQPQQAITQDQVVGTPHYMAPEQVEKPHLVDHRADIYSLGVVFYEMLTGELPLGKFQPPSKKVQVDVRLDDVVLHALEKEPERRYQKASEVKTAVETIVATPGAPAAAGTPAGPPVVIKRWRDAWMWNWEYIQLFLIVPLVVVGLALPFCLHWWGLRALWLFTLELPGIAFAITYAVVGRRLRQAQAALPRTEGEAAECLMFRRPFQSPGLAVMHEDRLELKPIVGSPIVVPLADIVAVKEVRWFNGRRLWFKTGFVMDLANGQRIGVAVAEVFARRWRAKLSGGALPEIPSDGGMDRSLCARAATRQASGFSRTALWAAGWLLICVVAQVWSYTPPGWAFNRALRSVLGDFVAEGLNALFLVVGFAAPVGVTVLGWVATTEIRRSGGRVRGLGLAFGEMVLFPLLALDAWLLWLCSQTGLKPVVGAAVALAADALLICRVWRWVRRPLAAAESTPIRPDDGLAATAPLASQLWRVARRAALVAALSLLLLETLLQLSVGWRESTEELWTMALYSACLAGMVWAAWPLRRQPWTGLLRAGAAFALFAAVSLASYFYSWHLRSNLGLYREPGWVEQHPSFQRELRQRIEKNLWRKPPGGPTEASAFGPVIERVLTDIGDRVQSGPAFLDLHTGRAFSCPSEEQFRSAGWWQTNECNLAVGHSKDGWVLMLRGSVLTAIPDKTWDQVGPLDVSRQLARHLPDPRVLDSKEFADRTGERVPEIFHSLDVRFLALGSRPTFPFLSAFQTQAGALGVLQITDFTESPRGLKIRYRLVRPQPGEGGFGGGQGGAEANADQDFTAQHRAELGQKALDAARAFVEEHNWKMQSEWGNQLRVVLKATDPAGKQITFEEAATANGTARFTVIAEPGAELSAQRIGAAIWRRLGWVHVSPGVAAQTPPPPVARAEAGTYQVTLANGITVEVVAVARNPLMAGLWWKPDGTLLAQPPGEAGEFRPSGMWTRKSVGSNDCAILVRFGGLMTARWQRGQQYAPRGEFTGALHVKNVGMADVVRFPAGTKEVAMHVATAAGGTWEPVAVFDGTRTRVLVEGIQVLCTHFRHDPDGTCLDVSHNVDRGQYALRMMARLKSGKRVEVGLHSGVLSARETQGYVFLDPSEPDLRAGDIAEFVLERTPWVSGEIHGIALAPRQVATLTPPSFGPAIERELGGWPTLDCTVLDLDQGRLLLVPTNIVAASMNNPRPMLNWMVERGADLTVQMGAGAGLHLDDGVLLRLEGDATFESVAASTVRRQLSSGGGAQDASISRAEVEAQPVFVYRTREGGMGVLQVLGASQDPRSLRIRFKAALPVQ